MNYEGPAVLGSWDFCGTQFPKEVAYDSWKSGSPAGSGAGAIAEKAYTVSEQDFSHFQWEDVEIDAFLQYMSFF